jgi:hypothetical protein
MAEAPDLELLIYRQIRTLLEGDEPGWASEIDVGNRIWYDVEQPNDPAKPTTADGDHPMSKLRARTGSTSLFTTDETFGTYAPEGPCDAVEKGTFVYRLTMTSQLLGQQEQSRLRKLAENVIRRSGPRLGLPYVTRVVLRWDTEEIDADREEGTKRERTEMDISIEYEASVKFISTGE